MLVFACAYSMTYNKSVYIISNPVQTDAKYTQTNPSPEEAQHNAHCFCVRGTLVFLTGLPAAQQLSSSSLFLSFSLSVVFFFVPARSFNRTSPIDSALIVPDELLHFPANVSRSAIGKESNEGKSLPPWRCHFHTLRLAACQADRTLGRGGLDSAGPRVRDREEGRARREKTITYCVISKPTAGTAAQVEVHVNVTR